MMSMAVADLRHSMLTSTASGASIYQSALTEAPLDENEYGEESGHSQLRESRSSTPTPPSGPKDDAQLLLSFGTEAIVLRMTTTRLNVGSTSIPQGGSNDRVAPREASDAMPAVEVDLSFGTIAALILPKQAATILSALQTVTPSGTDTSPKVMESIDSTDMPQAKLVARVKVKALFASIVYDLSAADNRDFSATVPNFWQKPSVTDVPVGHLKLRLDTLQAVYQSLGHTAETASSHTQRDTARRASTTRKAALPPSFSLSLADFSIFEYLASAPATEEDSPPGGSFPVFIFDSNLRKQYEHDIAGRSGSMIPPPVFPEFDGIDWRNSGLQRRGAAAEKMWKVKQRGRGVLKGGLNGPELETGPVVSLHKEMSYQARKFGNARLRVSSD
jgi:autophagy-related protein 2